MSTVTVDPSRRVTFFGKAKTKGEAVTANAASILREEESAVIDHNEHTLFPPDLVGLGIRRISAFVCGYCSVWAFVRGTSSIWKTRLPSIIVRSLSTILPTVPLVASECQVTNGGWGGWIYLGVAGLWGGLSWTMAYNAIHLRMNLFLAGSLAVTSSISTLGLQVWHKLSSGTSPACDHRVMPPGVLLLFGALFVISHLHDRDVEKRRQILKHRLDQTDGLIKQITARSAARKNQLMQMLTNELLDAMELSSNTLQLVCPKRQLLKPQEQLAASGLLIPTPSLTALNLATKHVTYLSTNLPTIDRLLGEEELTERTTVQKEFDICGLMQYLGDLLAGTASAADVELVLYHIDYGLHHSNIIGDEGLLRHALMNLLKTLIDSCNPGSSIEMGLQVQPVSPNSNSDSINSSESVGDHHVQVTFEITANLSQQLAETPSLDPILSPNANLLPNILKYIGATLSAEDRDGRQHILVTFQMPSGSTREEHHSIEEIQPLENCPRIDIKSMPEPTHEELQRFSQSVSGLKVALHASAQSVFAKHITTSLAIWGLDVSHFAVGEGSEESEGIAKDATSDEGVKKTHDQPSQQQKEDRDIDDAKQGPSQDPPTFIIIDDDVATLERIVHEQQEIRPSRSYSLPTTWDHHISSRPKVDSTVIYFTSLQRYKQVKYDIQQYVTSVAAAGLTPIQIAILPKPAGPRRILTALYATFHHLATDGNYVPLATTPISMSDPFYHLPSPSPAAATAFERTKKPNMVAYHSDSQIPLYVGSPTGVPTPHGVLFDPNNISSKATASCPPVFNFPPQRRPRSPSAPARRQRSSSDVRRGEEIGSKGNNPGNTASQTPPSPPHAAPPQKFEPNPVVERRATDPPAGPPKPIHNLVKSPPINVLIVEDNPINQTILSTFMKKRKIKYSVANNGLEAVEKWKQGGFHLVLMDIQLPVMSGIDATKEIRRYERDHDVGVFATKQPTATETEGVPIPPSPFRSPVIIVALTASSLQSDRHAALAAGCNDFLTKPVSLVWLERKIVEWGCMQALIDFEGWRRWKKAEDTLHMAERSGSDFGNGSGKGEKSKRARGRSQVRTPSEESKKGARFDLKLPGNYSFSRGANVDAEAASANTRRRTPPAEVGGPNPMENMPKTTVDRSAKNDMSEEKVDA
ncbi:uncharacterized protein VTP21DRAFT_1812 [Calcarisporiella thermophila]|uniref:uncharacterized protein n=1 Tax=Calcarisporiella thermophila TaxID=911321 RepID=UPI003744A6B1